MIGKASMSLVQTRRLSKNGDLYEGKLEKFRKAACNSGRDDLFVLAVAEPHGVR